jgi:CRISPR-associated protein Csb2
MLAIEVTFLTGRYVATSYNSRAAAEWPPHPARLFSALVATHFAADLATTAGHESERVALEWLEGLGAPRIQASDAAPRDVVTVFVPVNDVAMTDVDAEAHAVDEARANLDSARAKGEARAFKAAQKAIAKAEAALTKAIQRATAVPASRVNPDQGRCVLPDHRTRQPRTFPSVTPDEPRVTFVWDEAAPTEAQQAALSSLLKRVVRLGHSSSLVTMRLTAAPLAPNWRPDDQGEATLRVVEAGQLEALKAAWRHHREEEPRVMPAVPQLYTRRASGSSAQVPTSLFSESWLVLRRVEGPPLPVVSAVGLARAVRRVLLSFAAEPIPEILSGHRDDGQPTTVPHVAVVPLPFVGHAQATGAILGVALIFPRAIGEAERRDVYRAVAAWEAAARQEDEDTPTVQVNLGPAGVLGLERVEWGTVQVTLRPSTWCGPAQVWSTVTPVALDRNPGNLSSRDPHELASAVTQAEATIRAACVRIGLPEPLRVEVLPAAPWAGAAKVRNYPPFPGLEGRIQRVLTHARVAFERAVRGPVLLGAGRFVGLGLFRPESR